MVLKLGDINFGLGADTSGLDRSVQQLQRFGTQVDLAMRRTSAGSDKVAAALRRQEAALTSALQKTLSLTTAARRSDAGESIIRGAAAAFEVYNNKLARAKVGTLQFQRATEQFTATLGTFRRKLQEAQENKFEQMLRNVSAAAVLASGPLSGVATRIATFAAVVKATNLRTASFVAGIAAGAAGVGKLGVAVLNNSRALDAIRGKFEAIAGSTALSNRLFDEAIGIAQRSGQAITDLASRYASFLAAADGTILAGQKSKDIFETMAQAISKLRLPTEQSEGVFRALEQMMSKGTVQAEELRNQLGDRLPGAFQIAARAIGVSTDELNKMLKKGQVISSDFLPKFAKEVAKTFNIGVGPVTSFQASINNLATSWSLFLDKLDKTFGVTTSAIAVLNALTTTLSSMKDHTDEIAGILGAIAGALLALSAGRIVAGIVVVSKAIKGATLAMLGLNAATMANPFGALATVLTRVAIALGGAVVGYYAMKKATQETDESTKDMNKAIDDFIGRSTPLKGAIGGIGQSMETWLISTIKETSSRLSSLRVQLQEAQQGGWSGLLHNLNPFNDDPEELKKRVADAQKIIVDAQARLKEVQARNVATKAPSVQFGPLDSKELRKHLEKITQQKEVLKEAQTELNRATQQATVATTGGTTAVDKLNAQFDLKDKVDAYAKKLQEAGVTAAIAAPQIEQYRNALQVLNTTTERAKAAETGADEAKKRLDILTKQKEVLAGTQIEMDRLLQTLSAFQTGGSKAVEELNKQFDMTDKVSAYAANLMDAGLSAEQAIPKLNAYRDTLRQLGQIQEIEVQRIALHGVQEEINRINSAAIALQAGGIPAFNALNEQFAKIDALAQYKQEMIDAGVSIDVATQKTNQYRDAIENLASVKQVAEEHQQVITAMNQTLESSFTRVGDAIAESIAKGKIDLQSFRDIFASIVADMIKEAIRLFVINKILSALSSGIGGYMGGGGAGGGSMGMSGGAPIMGGSIAMAKGGITVNAFKMPKMRKAAKGTILTSATMFSTANGPVMGGEAGKEAMLPLKRNASGQLGVIANGTGATNISVVIQTPNPTAFKQSEQQVVTAMRRAVMAGGRGM